MIDRERILRLVEPLVEEKELFIILLEVSSSNKIILHIDSMKGVSIDECVALSRKIEQGLDREAEDFALEVSSAGLDAPFVRIEQYKKNIGRQISVLMPDGRKETGKLTAADAGEFTVEQEQRVKIEGKKKKQLVVNSLKFKYAEVQKVKLELKFK